MGVHRIDGAPSRRFQPDSDKEIAALRQELATVKSEVLAMKKQVESLAGPEKNPAAAGSVTLPLSEADMDGAAESARQLGEDAGAELQHQLASIESGFLAEPRDAAWAEQTAARIREAWNRTQSPDIHIAGLDCRASLCRMEIQATGDGTDLSSDLFAELSPDLPAVIQQPAAADGDAATTVYYLARERFPSPL
jgi:hypothetical protein